MPESSALDPHLRDDIEIRRVGPVDVELRDDGAHVAFGGGRIRFPLTSRHQAQNALTALTAYDALGLPLDLLAESAAGVRISPWRGEELAAPGRRLRRSTTRTTRTRPRWRRRCATSPSVARGLRRLAILGGMAELGEHAERHHREIAELAARARDRGDRGRRARARLTLSEMWEPDAAAALATARDLVRPGDAVLVKASRAVALEGIAPDTGERHRVVSRVFIAGLIAMVISVVIGPKFIEFLRRNELGQPIREEGPAGHVVKQGTPVMGGLLILLCALLSLPRALAATRCPR